MTLWEQPSHLILMSIPIRMTFQRFVPHGCGFFISTTSFRPNSLSANTVHLSDCFVVILIVQKTSRKGQFFKIPASSGILKSYLHLIQLDISNITHILYRYNIKIVIFSIYLRSGKAKCSPVNKDSEARKSGITKLLNSKSRMM